VGESKTINYMYLGVNKIKISNEELERFGEFEFDFVFNTNDN